ncbi:MAG: hypothetical protein JWQ72_3524 [Polaromonas sp.]|nr:hypothetical protein [Polaromonas sp.]
MRVRPVRAALKARSEVLYKIELLCGAAWGLTPVLWHPKTLHPMVSNSAKEVFIQGITLDGKTFRPSDWADRLCGVMSNFRPGGPQPGSHLTYSPWCVPTVINDVKCVVVNAELRDAEPMAWDFVMNFAKDNALQVAEACMVPPPAKG